jgi:hypothetical protein
MGVGDGDVVGAGAADAAAAEKTTSAADTASARKTERTGIDNPSLFARWIEEKLDARYPDLRIVAVVLRRLPIALGDSDVRAAPRLQWRDRAGIPPASRAKSP